MHQLLLVAQRTTIFAKLAGFKRFDGPDVIMSQVVLAWQFVVRL